LSNAESSPESVCCDCLYWMFRGSVPLCRRLFESIVVILVELDPIDSLRNVRRKINGQNRRIKRDRQGAESATRLTTILNHCLGHPTEDCIKPYVVQVKLYKGCKCAILPGPILIWLKIDKNKQMMLDPATRLYNDKLVPV
jgi:hypothetical protein